MLLEEIDGEDLDLQLTETMLEEPPENLRGIFRVGEPVVHDAVRFAEVAGEALNPEASLLADRHDFYMVRIPTSIRPRERTTVSFFSVECSLKCPAGPVVCWSMMPERVEDEVKVGSETKLSAQLKIAASVLGGEHTAHVEYVVYQPLITAFGIGEADPAWEFDPAKGRRLRGVQMLHMVIKTPKGATGEGVISIRADVIERGILWNTRAIGRSGSEIVQRFIFGSI